MHNAFLSLCGLSQYRFHEILDTARRLKAEPKRFRDRLRHRTFALIFAPDEFRARISFEIAIHQLGGRTVRIDPEEVWSGGRPAPDVAPTLTYWTDGIAVRLADHAFAAHLAGAVDVPVINCGSDESDPCQGLTGVFTLRELRKDLSRLKIAGLGLSKPGARSWLSAAARAGSHLVLSQPPRSEPDPEDIERALEQGRESGFRVDVIPDPAQAVHDADVIVSGASGPDAAYRIDQELLRRSNPKAVVLPWPSTEGQTTISGEIFTSERCAVSEQIENRLHIQKAIVVLLYERSCKDNGKK